MRLLQLISWPYIRKHLLRYSLLVAGVALGVAVAVALEGGERSVVAEFRRMLDQIAGTCQLQVSAGEAGIPEAFLEHIQELPEVSAASPVIEALTDVERPAGSRLLIIGVDMTGDAGMRPWLSRGSGAAAGVDPVTFLAQPDSILLGRAFSLRHGWGIGSKLNLRTMAGPKTFTVRGLLAGEDLERIFGGNVAVMDVYGAQYVFGRKASVDRIDVVLAENCSLDDGRRAIQRITGAGYSVDPPAARGEQFEDLLNAYQSLQIMACLFTVGLGVCMIDAAFRLAVAQRRVEIGILRCLGATRRQVQVMFILEGVATGILGSALGLLLGIQFFRMLASTTEGLFRGTFGGLTEQTYRFQISPAVIALAFLMGIGISLLASWLPSRQAAHSRPVEAFRQMHFQQGLEAWRPRPLILAALLACGAWLGSAQERAQMVFYASMAMLFLAALAAIPSCVLAIFRPLRPLFARWFGVEGGLALDSLSRAPRRTVTTIAVLVLVFAQTIMIGGINRSSRQTLDAWLQSAFHSDLLSSSSANLASQTFRFPPGVDEILRGVPGVASVQALRAVHVPYRGKPVLILATDYALSARKGAQPVVAGVWRDMCEQAAAGRGLFISQTLAMREHLGLGSQVEIAAPAGALRLPVRGIVNDHSDKRGVIFLSLTLYQHYWGDPAIDKFRIDVTPGLKVDDVRTRLREALGDRYPASFLTRDEARAYVFHPRGRKLSPLDMQLLISLLVGALALMNMASISVAERSREFALLRSLGGYRRQVRKTLLVELLSAAGVALLLGLVLGALLLAFLLAAVHRYVNGVLLDYYFPWNASLWLIAVASLAGIVAVLAVAPGLARLPLSVALDSE